VSGKLLSAAFKHTPGEVTLVRLTASGISCDSAMFGAAVFLIRVELVSTFATVTAVVLQASSRHTEINILFLVETQLARMTRPPATGW
jgi:hypothetical protein